MRKILFVSVVFFCCAQLFGKGTVYVIDESFPSVGLKKGTLWGDLKDAIERLGYGFKWTGSLAGIRECECIICHKPPLRELKRQLHPKEKLVLFLWEPVVVRPYTYKKRYLDYFSKIYTWSDALVDNKRFFKFCFPLPLTIVDDVLPFHEKKLAVMINSNRDSNHPLSLYGERRNVIHFFENNHSEDFDLYGYDWQASLKNYRGSIPSKLECLKQYKFCFAYENMHSVDGYITEKIFDSFKAACVPIYWGAKNITHYVPEGCFIDRRAFTSDEELYRFLKAMTQEEHQHYINNIRAFLKTAQPLPFSYARLIDAILSAVEPGYNRKVALTEKHKNDLERLDYYRKEHPDFPG